MLSLRNIYYEFLKIASRCFVPQHDTLFYPASAPPLLLFFLPAFLLKSFSLCLLSALCFFVVSLFCLE